jgi:hypothetical protein
LIRRRQEKQTWSKLPNEPPPERRSRTSVGNELATVAPEAATTVAKVGPLALLTPGGSDNKFRLTNTGLTLRWIPKLRLIWRSSSTSIRAGHTHTAIRP